MIKNIFFAIALGSGTLATSAQCVQGDCVNGLGSKIVDRAGYKTEGFFKDGMAEGPSRTSLNLTGAWEYGNRSGAKMTNMIITQRDGRTDINFYAADGKEISPAFTIDAKTQKTLYVVGAGNKVIKAPLQNGQQSGCLAGDCNMDYSEYRFADGTEFHGTYFYGVPRRGIIISADGYYIGEVSVTANRRSGFGYMLKGDIEYLGFWSNDAYEGQGFEMKNGKLLRGGLYAKGKLVMNELTK